MDINYIPAPVPPQIIVGFFTAPVAILGGILIIIFRKQIIDHQRSSAERRGGFLAKRIASQPQSYALRTTMLIGAVFIFAGVLQLINAY